jgi:hypothetical protein
MSYSPEQIQRVANMLRYSGTDEFSEEAADMLNDFATLHQQAARVDEGMVDCAWAALTAGVEFLEDLTRDNVRAALEAALSAQPAERQGEAVAEVCKGAFGIHYIACADPNKLPVGTKLYDHPAAPVGVPKVTLDMMREVEHLCPTEQPHLDKLRWKARRLTELLAAAPSATQGVE